MVQGQEAALPRVFRVSRQLTAGSWTPKDKLHSPRLESGVRWNGRSNCLEAAPPIEAASVEVSKPSSSASYRLLHPIEATMVVKFRKLAASAL